MNVFSETMVRESLGEPLGWGMADPTGCGSWWSHKTGNAKVQPSNWWILQEAHSTLQRSPAYQTPWSCSAVRKCYQICHKPVCRKKILSPLQAKSFINWMKHGKTGTMLLWEGALAAATQELSCDLGEKELHGQKTERQSRNSFGF